MVVGKRKKGLILHSHSAECSCEPVAALICECCPGFDFEKADPTCMKCHGLGRYRLPVGVAPRDGTYVFYVCRDGNEGRYPLWEGFEG